MLHETMFRLANPPITFTSERWMGTRGYVWEARKVGSRLLFAQHLHLLAYRCQLASPPCNISHRSQTDNITPLESSTNRAAMRTIGKMECGVLTKHQHLSCCMILDVKAHLQHDSAGRPASFQYRAQCCWQPSLAMEPVCSLVA